MQFSLEKVSSPETAAFVTASPLSVVLTHTFSRTSGGFTEGGFVSRPNSKLPASAGDPALTNNIPVATAPIAILFNLFTFSPPSMPN